MARRRLLHLRESPQTAGFPLVFMTARVQERDLAYFRSIGASGVIVKPFDPMRLAESVRRELVSAVAPKARSLPPVPAHRRPSREVKLTDLVA